MLKQHLFKHKKSKISNVHSFMLWAKIAEIVLNDNDMGIDGTIFKESSFKKWLKTKQLVIMQR